MTAYKHALAAIAVVAALVAAPASAIASPVTVMPGQILPGQDSGAIGDQARVFFFGGGGTLRFSNGGIGDNGLLSNGNRPTVVGGLVGALNTGKVSLTAVDGATILSGVTPQSELGQVALVNGRKARGLVGISATVTSLQVDDQTGAFGLVTSQGGAQQDAPFIEATLDGGRMIVNNLRFDLPSKTVIADMLAQPLDFDTGTLGTATQFTDVPLWTFSSILGPTALPPAAMRRANDGDFSELQGLGYSILSKRPSVDMPEWGALYKIKATNVFSGLKVTERGFAIFAQGLGLTTGSVGYDALNNVNSGAEGWGSITSELLLERDFVYIAIPEPSTYALMGLGLVCIAAVARRGRA